MAGLDDLYALFQGQTNTALNQPQQPWQNELMASVNPDKQRHDNIRMALAQASQALATTPGNFLAGLSAAAGTGANSYLQAKQNSEDARIKAMQITALAQPQQQDRRLQLLHDAIGVGRDLSNDKVSAADRADRRKLTEAQVGYYSRRNTGNGNPNSSTALERADHDLRVWIGQAANGGTPPTQEEINAQWQSILKNRGLDDSNAAPQASNAPGTEEDWTQQADAYTADPNADPMNGNVTQTDLMTGGAKPKVAHMRPSPQSGAPAAITPPAQAIEFLRQNPGAQAQFDAKYEQGAAAKYLGK